jgi:hypothetical protein
MTADEMKARIAELEGVLADPKRARAHRSASNKATKLAEKARKAQFKLEALKRSRLGSTLNRYHC